MPLLIIIYELIDFENILFWTYRELNSRLTHAKGAVCHLPIGPFKYINWFINFFIYNGLGIFCFCVKRCPQYP